MFYSKEYVVSDVWALSCFILRSAYCQTCGHCHVLFSGVHISDRRVGMVMFYSLECILSAIHEDTCIRVIENSVEFL